MLEYVYGLESHLDTNHLPNTEIDGKLHDMSWLIGDIVLTVNDDLKEMLGDVSTTVFRYNKQAGKYNSEKPRDRLRAPHIVFIGYHDPTLFGMVYTGVDHILDERKEGRHANIHEVFSGRDEEDGDQLFIQPFTGAPSEHSVICHAQDLRLIDQSMKGTEVVELLENMRASGAYPDFHFMFPWSTLHVVREGNWELAGFRSPSTFYVMPMQKALAPEPFDSYGPMLIRGVIEGLRGQRKIANTENYDGPLTLHERPTEEEYLALKPRE